MTYIKDSYINCSGLETNQSIQTMLYHFPEGMCNLNPEKAWVPLHYMYDYAQHQPLSKNLRFDFVHFEAQYNDEYIRQLKLSKTVEKAEIRAGGIPIIQIGTQMATFTYRCPDRVKHHVFPYSTAMLELFWFLNDWEGVTDTSTTPNYFLKYINDHLSVFIKDCVAEMLNEKQQFDNSAWKMFSEALIVDAFPGEKTNEQMTLLNTIKQALSGSGIKIFKKSDQEEFRYEIKERSDYPKLPASIYVDWYHKDSLFDSQYKYSLVKQFKAFLVPRDNVHSICYANMVVQSLSNEKTILVPLNSIGEGVAGTGFLTWLIFGGTYETQENGQIVSTKLYLGIGWFKNQKGCTELFPIRLTQNQVE